MTTNISSLDPVSSSIPNESISNQDFKSVKVLFLYRAHTKSYSFEIDFRIQILKDLTLWFSSTK